ncbi:MAG: phosphoribosylanthranilate isomerase [Candidatus Sumerlaeia bacterium]|nr:phosphoribosylanthranilate isomerase [Candidatus Sumerlaeia bacterium]
MSPVRVKVCCISSPDEARLAIAAGASALGLVSAMPSGPGVIAEESIAEIAATIPPGVTSVLLSGLRTADALAAQHRRCRTNAIQLVDAVSFEELARLREALPGIGLIQVIHVRGAEAIDEARMLADSGLVDALLLDSGNPTAAVAELGGTGRVHDWAISRRLVESVVPVPVYLAGGLTPDNVADAVRAVQPFGLDVCSGLRTLGKLDPAKVEAFFNAL